MGVLSFLLGSKLGRYIALGGLTVVIILTILSVFYRKGINAEKARQQAKRLQSIRDAIEIRRDIQAMPPDERRKELMEWSRE